MRRIVLSAAIYFAAVAAVWGQAGQVPNNTVQGNVSGASAPVRPLTKTQLTTLCNAFTSVLTGCAPASGGGTANFLRADGTWVGAAQLSGNNIFTGTNTFNPASGDAITINPAALSTSKAINITQSTPTSGTFAGPLALNLFNITDSFSVTGTGVDSTGLNNGGAVGFRVNTFFSGANVHAAGTLISGLYTATVTSTAAQGDITGLAGTAYTNVAASIGGFLEGLNGVAIVGASGSGVNVLVGGDFGASILTGGSANYRFGIDVASLGNVQGTTNDAAIALMGTGGGAIAWKNGILLTNASGGAPLSTTGSLIKSDTANTIANILDLGNITVTGNIAAFPFLGISGAGKAIFGAPIASLGAGLNFEVTAASSGNVGIQVSTNSTTGYSGLSALNSTSATEIDVIANEANRTTVHFGQTVGNWGEIAVTSPNGMLLGTAGAVPLIIGTNNTARMRITGAGLVNIGTDVAPLATLTVNKNAAAPAAAVSATSIFQAVAADSVEPVMMIDGFGTGNIQPFIVTRRARGTGASFTAVQNGDALGYFGMVGSTGANTFASETAAVGTTGGAFFGASATENWSGTNQGTELKLYATPTGALAIVQGLGVNAGVIIGTPTGTYKGTGTLNIAGAIYANGTIGATCAAGISATTGRSVGGIITAC